MHWVLPSCFSLAVILSSVSDVNMMTGIFETSSSDELRSPATAQSDAEPVGLALLAQRIETLGQGVQRFFPGDGDIFGIDITALGGIGALHRPGVTIGIVEHVDPERSLGAQLAVGNGMFQRAGDAGHIAILDADVDAAAGRALVTGALHDLGVDGGGGMGFVRLGHQPGRSDTDGGSSGGAGDGGGFEKLSPCGIKCAHGTPSLLGHWLETKTGCATCRCR